MQKLTQLSLASNVGAPATGYVLVFGKQCTQCLPLAALHWHTTLVVQARQVSSDSCARVCFTREAVLHCWLATTAGSGPALHALHALLMGVLCYSLPALQALALWPLNWQVCSNEAVPALVPGNQENAANEDLGYRTALPECEYLPGQQ